MPIYSLFLKRLSEIKKKNGLIPMSSIFLKICRNFSITKKQCWEILFLLNETGFIKIHGVKGIEILNKQNKNPEKITYAEDIPKTCINHCDKCKKEFEAKISIGETCAECFEDMKKRIDERVKIKMKENHTELEQAWIRFEAMIEEFSK